MRRILAHAAAVGLLLLISGAARATADAVTLIEAEALALEGSPEIELAAAQADAAGARLLQARSMWLPHVQLSDTWMRSDNPVFVFGSLLEQGRFGAEHFDPFFLNDPPELENHRLALSLRAPLFDQFRRVGRIRQARLGSEGARQMLAGTRQQQRFEVLRLYDAAVVADERRRVALESVRSADADVAFIRDRFETGILVESDLLAAEVQLASFRQRLIEAEGDAAIAHATLQAALGLPSTEPLVLASADLALPPRPPAARELIAALDRRPDLVASELSTRAAAVEHGIAKGSWLPRLDAFATFAASGESFDDTNGDRTVGAVLSFDVLQPGRLGRIAESKAAERAARAGADRLRRDAELEILTATTRHEAARQMVLVADAASASATEALRIVRDRYGEGLTTITEQLHAQMALLDARLQALQARAQARLTWAGVLLSSGTLDSLDPLGGNE